MKQTSGITMKRAALVEAMDITKAALSDKNIIPILKHFWFTGKTLLTYNDVISISTPLLSSFVGAVPELFLKMLKMSRHTDINLSIVGNVLSASAGKLRLKLPVLGEDCFIFTMPEGKKGVSVSEDFLDKIKNCLVSVRSDNVLKRDMMGITLIPQDNKLIMISYNGGTMTWASHNNSFGLKKQVILSGIFCEQLVALGGKRKTTLEITNEHSIAMFDDGIKLFGKLIDVSEPLKLNETFNDYKPKSNEFMAVPNTLLRILNRSTLIIAGSAQSSHTRITCANNKLTFTSNSERGNLVESVSTEKQFDIDIEVKPDAFSDGCSLYNSMAITDRCVTLTNDKKDVYYLITVRNLKDKY